MGILARRWIVGQECPTYVFRSDEVQGHAGTRSVRSGLRLSEFGWHRAVLQRCPSESHSRTAIASISM